MFESITNFSTYRKNPVDLLRCLVYKHRFLCDNPTYFDPSGIWVYCGAQGSGKTLSAVQTLKNMLKLYPRAVVCSNIDIHGIDREIIPFTDYSQITDLTNGIEGVIFFIDEIHVLWNSLESKDIPISEMAIFCQNRKDRRVIIGTSQVYSRIAKPIREQLQYVVSCRNYFNLVQVNDIVDPSHDIEKSGHITGDLIKRQIFFHSPEMYKSYDTLNKVSRLERKEILKNDRNSKRLL